MADRLELLVKKASKGGYPQSLQVSVWHRGRQLTKKKWGKSYKYYDVGSLTKILVTTPLIMKLWEEKRIDINKPVSTYLKFLQKTKVGKILVKDLLRHLSGLEWWRPYFGELRKLPMDQRKYALKNRFRSEKVGAAKHCVYSDLDFIILGWVVEEILGLPLDEAARLYLFEPLHMKNTFFIPQTVQAQKSARIQKKFFAPTEKHKFRGTLQATVFDDNAWAMGGVSGHAGLFSTLDDVTRMGQEFFQVSQGKKHSLWKPSTLRYFTKRAVSTKQGDWALGFIIPSRPMSTGGRKISSQAFGHTGYTGTSVWIDRKRQAVVTVLSNRTFPTRNDERFKILRQQIHDTLWEQIDGQKT